MSRFDSVRRSLRVRRPLIGVIEPARRRRADARVEAIEQHARAQSRSARLRAAAARGACSTPRPRHYGRRSSCETEVQDAFGTGRASGFDTAETTFALSQVVELGDKRALRVDAANADAALIDAERAAAELDVLAEVTRRFIHVAADQEHLALTSARDGARRGERRRGDGARRRRARARRRAAPRARHARARRSRAGACRARALDVAAQARRDVGRQRGDVRARRRRSLRAAAERRLRGARRAARASIPDFARFASEERLRDAELRVAEAHARTNLTVTGRRAACCTTPTTRRSCSA